MDENNTNQEEKVEKTTEENTTYNPKDTATTSYEPEVVQTSYESSTSSEKKEKKKKQKDSTEPTKKKGTVKLAIIIILIVSVLVAIVTAVYYLFFAATTIDLSEHISVTYDGYDGYAIATVDFKSSLKKAFDESSVYKKFKKKAELEITSDNNGELKNGDTLKVKVDVSKSWLEKNKIKLKDRTIEIKVSGVPEPRKVDVFEDLEYTITGVSPNLYLSVENNSDDEFIDTIYYSLSDSYGLANGDKVTITASYSTYDAQEMGVIVEDETLEYTIENQPYYADKKESLGEGAISSLSTKMSAKVKDYAYNGKGRIYNYYDQYNPTNYYSDDLVAGEPELVNLYLLTLKDSSSYSYNNYVYGIYKITYTSTETSQTYDWYFISYTNNIVLTSDGDLYTDDITYSYSCQYYEGESKDSLYNDYVDTKKSNYTIETIK